jgi:mannose-6-phosphate isomerase-like protein (cupin superfamily)
MLIILISTVLLSCSKNKDILIVPPSAPPLTRSVIGYGMLTDSYTHILDQPQQGAVSLGYLREGTIVPVLERRMIEQNKKTESWVFIKGNYEGWLKEESIVIYENEAQAKTASASLDPRSP